MSDDSFNFRLHKLRKMRGFTLKYLGDCAGFAESTMCQYEAGNREPTIETLIHLAELLEVSVGCLVGTEPMPRKVKIRKVVF